MSYPMTLRLPVVKAPSRALAVYRFMQALVLGCWDASFRRRVVHGVVRDRTLAEPEGVVITPQNARTVYRFVCELPARASSESNMPTDTTTPLRPRNQPGNTPTDSARRYSAIENKLLGARTRAAMKQRGWSVREAARETNLSESVIQKLRNGQQLRMATIERWAKAIGEDPEEWSAVAAYNALRKTRASENAPFLCLAEGADEDDADVEDFEDFVVICVDSQTAALAKEYGQLPAEGRTAVDNLVSALRGMNLGRIALR
jgi:transcriptional regulator with XRE-family HTH domain